MSFLYNNDLYLFLAYFTIRTKHLTKLCTAELFKCEQCQGEFTFKICTAVQQSKLKVK